MTSSSTTEAPAGVIPEGAAPVRLPVMVVEGMETADGRFIEPGSLSTRVMPIALYSQVRSSHGGLDGDTSTVLAGAITSVTRRPGPEVVQLSTGQPFPDETFVWQGDGWMYTDVPAPPEKSAYTLVKDKALRGNSVDLSEVAADLMYADGQDLDVDPHPERIVITEGVIGATTLVGQPAFPDAYIELDGMPFVADSDPIEAVTAGGVPAWRSAETGDLCSPCVAVDGPHDQAITAALGYTDPGEASAFAVQSVLGEDMEPGDIVTEHTGGMIALVPSNPNMLRVPDGDAPEELHLTLAYLGDDVSGWRPEDIEAVYRIALEATNFDAMRARLTAEAEERGDPEPLNAARDADEYGRSPAQKGPLDGVIFSHAVFNPNGDNGHDPASVYLLDGSGDRPAIDGLADMLTFQARDAIGTAQFPDQYRPYVPHITAGYNIPVDQLTYTGPVQFDRLRLALGNQVIDFPLGGGDPLTGERQTIIAAGAPLPPAEIFDNPNLTEPTPPTVLDDGRAFGHLACWGTCHIGFAGKCVTPPRSNTGYAYFMVHSARAVRDGEVVDVPVGWGTLETGHADVRRDALAAASHYDDTGTVAFEYAVGEDEHGIWFAGRMLPGLPEELEHKARGAVFSGDWRTIRGNLELVASLGVNVPGFPVPRVRVASGVPVALVAAGVPARPAVPSDDVRALAAAGVVKPSELRELLGFVREHKHTREAARALAAIEELTDGVDAALAESAGRLLGEVDRLTGGTVAATVHEGERHG